MVNDTSLRIVFFGTPAFAVPTLDRLIGSRHLLVAVVTQPDRRRGRGQKIADAPVKARATEVGVPVLQPDRLKDPAFIEAFTALGADIGVVAAYGKILTDQVLAIPRLGLINVHASLLPKYRGAAPVHRAIIAGERETGVTIMRVVTALDAGPMLAARKTSIGDDETSEAVERRLAALGADMLLDAVDRLAGGPVAEVPQNDAEATYAPKLTKEDGVIDWTKSATAIHNQIRGLLPWPHAFAQLDRKRIVFWSSALGDGAADHPPGTVVAAAGDRLLVATGDGLLALTKLQAEGKRPMTTREFLAGHRIVPGSQFVAAP
jgi:methionyl-tRNA formyltransferase